jgi:outer membrane receptor for ferrienterochelin and colicins
VTTSKLCAFLAVLVVAVASSTAFGEGAHEVPAAREVAARAVLAAPHDVAASPHDVAASPHDDAASPHDDAAATHDVAVAAGEIIVVTGSRVEQPRQAAPITTEVIDRQRLVESGVQTVGEALALRPGLWIERGVFGARGISMQGLGPQYALVLVDGARQIGRTSGVLDLDRFAVEDIEQIEIVRGPSSVLYGSDALGGVINIVPRMPREGVAFDALARLDGRLGYEARARVAGGTRTTAASLTGSYRAAPAIRLDDASVATTFAAYEDAHLTARGIHRPGQAWRLDASADYLRRDMRGVATTAGGAVLDRRNVVESATTQVIARWHGERTSMRVGADASVYRDQFVADQRMASALDQYQLTDENLVEAHAQLARQLGRHRLAAGAELMREALESDRLSRPGDRLRAAVFAQDEWRPTASDALVLAPAARLDADTQFGMHATPRLAMRWALANDVVARTSTGMGYRAPSFKEMLLLFQNPGAGYLVEGNPMLEPETSVSVQAGVEWQATSWLALYGDGYLNRLRDMIFVVSLPADGTRRFGYANIGRARTAGAEAYAIATHGRAGAELGYALTRTRDLDADRPLEGIPAHRASATLRWRDKREGFEAFTSAVLTGHRPFDLADDPQQTTSTPRRIEVRAHVAKRFSSGLGGFMGVENLLDAGDAELDRIPPRTLYAGVEAHY